MTNPLATPVAATASMLRAELTVAAITERDGRFLVVEEDVHGRRVINQPAGHVEAGENLLAAVRRETLEETAFEFEPEAVVGIYLWQPTPEATPFLRVAFRGRCTSHHADRALDDGIVQALWLSRGELQRRGDSLRSPMVLRGIDDYLAGQRLRLDELRDPSLETLARLAARL